MTTIAIYSRKSIFTGKGESIENQISLCKNYCKLHYFNKNIKFIVYEDEGFSGKDTHRPQFQKLLSQIKEHKIDTLICYRLDRISRNVADFSSTLELLQKYNVNFISIKEQFDTSTPMGRAMIYIASVFAQLERETIAERVRDNMIQLAKTGRWLGGTIPFGFNTEKKTYLNEDLKEKTLTILVPNNDELSIVKKIYELYLNHHSIRDVARILTSNDYKGKKGGNFDTSIIRRILRNPLYVISDDSVQEYLQTKCSKIYGTPNGNGYLTYNKKNQNSLSNNSQDWIITISNHRGIISSSNWLSIQNILDLNKEKNSRLGTGNSNHALFSGLLKCQKCDSNMVVVLSGHNSNNNLPYEYYCCSHKVNKFSDKCTCKNVSVKKLDDKLLSEIKINNRKIFINALKECVSSIEKNSINRETLNIQSEISEKESQVKTLITMLSKTKSQSVSNRILAEINNLDNNIKSLKTKVKNLNKQTSKNSLNNINIKSFLYSLSNFKDTINLIEDISQKRFLIQTVIEFAIWDSDKDNISIHLL